MKKSFVPSKRIRISHLLVFAFAGVTAVASLSSCNGSSSENDTPKVAAASSTEKASKTIPGLKPVDIYLNMEKQGFTIKKDFNSEYGNSWDCKSSSAGIDYTVNVFSHETDEVETVRATAMLNGKEEKKIIATMPFIKYVASIPYEGADPAKVGEWLDKNFSKDKAHIDVSGVRFTIYAPTKMLRMLSIEKTNL